jgi:tetratricopeptide (TPR) repeat protein
VNNKTWIISLLTVVLGAGGGFLIANSFNRSEMETLRQENERLKQTIAETEKAQAESTLSLDEIKARISEADSNPGNLTFNRDLGLALYRYSAMKRDVPLLKETLRLLERVNSSSPKDYDVLVALGNTHFDIGTFAGETERFPTARGIYDQAAAIKPDDPNVRTDIALTYFLQRPAAYDQAAAEFERAIKADPKNERALQFLVQTHWQSGDQTKAAEALAKLRAVNPSNQVIPELESMLTKTPPTK